MKEIEQEIPSSNFSPIRIKIHNVAVVALSCLAYALVFFHRSMPAIVTTPMAQYFHKDKADLTIFSSIFFWPYAVMQIFGGLLADIMDPSLLIVIMILLASIGSFIDGIEKNLSVGIFGRFIVGIGAGPIFVPITRILSNWFHAKYYALIVGIVLACGGAGGILAQSPLQAFEAKFGWRWSFYGISILGVIVAVLNFIFVRSRPSKFGYPDPETAPAIAEHTAKELFSSLLSNFIKVIKKIDYWAIALYCFMANGQYFNMTGMWAGPYVEDLYPKFHKGNTLISLSIAMIAGSIVYPTISDLLHTRKWFLVGFDVVDLVLCIMFDFIKPNLKFGELFVAFFFWGIVTGAVTAVSFPLIRENFESQIAATATGAVNFLAFVGGAIFQTISGSILKKYGKKQEGTDRYTPESFRDAIWIPSTCYTVVSFIGLFLISKDGQFARKKLDEGDQEQELENHHSMENSNEDSERDDQSTEKKDEIDEI